MYDLKDFVEFNRFLYRYKLMYIKRDKKEDDKKDLIPEYEDLIFKDLRKD